MKPTVGRIVHFIETGTGPLAAIVTDVDDAAQTVALSVFVPGESAVMALENVPHESTASNGRFWFWPPREV